MAKESQSRASRHDSKKRRLHIKAPNKKSRKGKRTIGSIFTSYLYGALFFRMSRSLIRDGTFFWWYAKDAPPLDEKQLDSAASSRFYASNGDLILDFGSETREKITANEIPQQLEDAIVSVEDRRFYQHIGVDPIRIIGSALSNVTTGGMQGGSTLTQQLIKLSFFFY